MSVKIRLQRHGKKGKPFYWIVAADARSKRDGKFLEKLGTYNPTANPAIIDLNLDKAVQWLHNGAQPTDTARAILSYKGALLKHHLDGGVRKGALTQDQADAKLAKWLEEKVGKVDAKKDGLSKKQAEAKAKALKAEKEANEKRAAKAEAAAAPEVVEEEVAEVTPEVEAAAEVTEAPETEAPAEEVVAEVAPEVIEAPAEEAVAEVAPEVEAAADETPAADEASEDSSDSEQAEQKEA
jgi:small subunit ribosomal protein S16